MIERIEQMLAMYESGAIDRRQFLSGLLAVSAAPATHAQAPKALFRGRVINHVTLSVAMRTVPARFTRDCSARLSLARRLKL